MPEYVLNRTYALRSMAGRVINFEKGVPAWVPPECEREALQIGAECVSGKKDILPPDEAPPVELTPEERYAKLADAYKTMEARNERDDFTGQGLPSTKVVQVLTGLTVLTKERDATWRKYKGLDE